MKNHQPRAIAALVLLLSISVSGYGQNRERVSELNVRAGMYFLASDSMQGRGSGTAFERIAAEYVGTQFMQFGLEPAGDPGWDGRPSYTQTATIKRSGFSDSPTLTFGTTGLKHGDEMIVLRASGGAFGGPLQKLELGAQPTAGSAVLVRVPANAPANMTQAVQAMATAGASLVIVEETAQYRTNWARFAGRRIPVNPRLARTTATVVVSKEAAAAIAALPDGTQLNFAGTVAEQTTYTWNAIGKITGTDKTLGSEVIVLSSHLDHTGVDENAAGPDKINNGADDDASGTVAVMEMARVLAAGKKPKRTIYFVCFGSEEAGGHGANHFLTTMPFPKEKMVANLQFEMIGRPDAKVKANELWLTGYDRSNLGPELASRGAMLVLDPRPEENFFQRSDNFAFARQGIIAHTVSSFGKHTDYHQVSDEIKTIDFSHMTRSINSMVKPVEWLVNSKFVPGWNPGKKP